jgi:methenyltetrahydromethanopterin cyclohydrolase
MSNTIIEYDNQQKISSIDFTSSQKIVDDVQICSTYRLGIVKKQVLVDHMPYAKALIY